MRSRRGELQVTSNSPTGVHFWTPSRTANATGAGPVTTPVVGGVQFWTPIPGRFGRGRPGIGHQLPGLTGHPPPATPGGPPPGPAPKVWAGGRRRRCSVAAVPPQCRTSFCGVSTLDTPRKLPANTSHDVKSVETQGIRRITPLPARISPEYHPLAPHDFVFLALGCKLAPVVGFLDLQVHFGAAILGVWNLALSACGSRPS